jgi:hypothetical protein
VESNPAGGRTKEPDEGDVAMNLENMGIKTRV